MTTRYLCVHGHFYQPPRENPSLEAVELQDSAYPYHDWNERITAECYAPNATSRILDREKRIVELVNNYEHISFNFGPTLLSWIDAKAPKVYEAIREADKKSQQRFSGHGNGIAQAYNHMILPLANPRDRATQIKWGIYDFKHRFGRAPEGMWLPETAVNTETLGVLADNGIRFTILAPRQAKRVRRHGSRNWKDVSGDRIDPSRAYVVRLPPRRNMAVFFYDGPISQAVAFEGVLDNGQRFADRLMSGFSDARNWDQLVHIATDGESYGHHHHFGEMALSYALHHIEANHLAQLTNYGEFLERFPPDHFAEIFDNSSWSCVHGIERWKSNCGCNSGGRAGWNQEWRVPLRAAYDWLRDRLIPLYEEHAKPLLKDPWQARDEYIRVILDRSPGNIAKFFGDHATHPLSQEEEVAALKLLEIQRHALLMYTSCGWFFDELSGIETVQTIQYAGRAVRLAQDFANGAIESEFLDRLSAAKSNIPEYGDGKRIYEKWVAPAFITPEKLAGHYAISSLFENYGDHTRIYCYDVAREDYTLEAEGKQRMAVGRAKFSSEITHEESDLGFAVLHLGDHNITGGTRHFERPEDYDALRAKLPEAFSKADTAEIIRMLTEAFPNSMFSLRTLFRDEQRKVLNIILDDSLELTAAAYRGIYNDQAPLIRFLNSLNIPVPAAFQSAAEIALNNQIKQALEKEELDTEVIRGYVKEAASSRVNLDSSGLEFVIRKRLEREAAQFASQPDNIANARKLRELLEFANSLPFQVQLWQVQNICYSPLIKTMDDLHAKVGSSPEVKSAFDELAQLREKLRINGTNYDHSAQAEAQATTAGS
jgi:alpha-amylase/alpha-mannosidase (GH57 family)